MPYFKMGPEAKSQDEVKEQLTEFTETASAELVYKKKTGSGKGASMRHWPWNKDLAAALRHRKDDISERKQTTLNDRVWETQCGDLK